MRSKSTTAVKTEVQAKENNINLLNKKKLASKHQRRPSDPNLHVASSSNLSQQPLLTNFKNHTKHPMRTQKLGTTTIQPVPVTMPVPAQMDAKQ